MRRNVKRFVNFNKCLIADTCVHSRRWVDVMAAMECVFANVRRGRDVTDSLVFGAVTRVGWRVLHWSRLRDAVLSSQ